MSLHHGAITLDGDPISVVVGIEGERIRLHSNGNEIGDWDRDECRIVVDPSGGFLIMAEDTELPFVPVNQPEFELALGVAEVEAPAERRSPHRYTEEAEPGPMTKLGFYLLAGVTTALGMWAIWSLIA